MPWEYLKTEPFDIRYKIASQHLPENKVVLDLDCGEPRFKNFIKYKKYYANDIYLPDDTSGIEFFQKPDTEIDIKPEILCLFGYGGGELTGQQLESQTVRESLIRLSKYKPEYIVIEMVQKWQEDYKALDWFIERLLDYRIYYQTKTDIEPITHYHNQRLITIFKK